MTPASPVEWGVAFCFGAIGVAILVFAMVNLAEAVRDARRGGGW